MDEFKSIKQIYAFSPYVLYVHLNSVIFMQ